MIKISHAVGWSFLTLSCIILEAIIVGLAEIKVEEDVITAVGALALMISLAVFLLTL